MRQVPVALTVATLRGVSRLSTHCSWLMLQLLLRLRLRLSLHRYELLADMRRMSARRRLRLRVLRLLPCPD